MSWKPKSERAAAPPKRFEEQVGVSDGVVDRFDDSPESAPSEQIASALVNKGIRLTALGHPHEAINAYDDVVARFGDAPNPRYENKSPRRSRDEPS